MIILIVLVKLNIEKPHQTKPGKFARSRNRDEFNPPPPFPNAGQSSTLERDELLACSLWSRRDSFPSRKLETTSQEKRVAELKRLHQFIQNKANNLVQQLAQGIVDLGVGSKCAQFIPRMASDKDTERLKNDAFYSMPMHCNYACRSRWTVHSLLHFYYYLGVGLNLSFFKFWNYSTFPCERYLFKK